MRIQIALISVIGLLMVVPAMANEIDSDVNLALLYSNGPCNCYAYAWQIQGTQLVSDSVTVKSSGFVTSFTFGVWVSLGDQPMTVTWMLGTTPGGNDLGAGTASLTNSSLIPDNGAVHNGNLNGLHFAVFNSTASGLSSGLLTAGNTYWFTLSDGVTQNGGFMGWDENDGFLFNIYSLLAPHVHRFDHSYI